jgi:hypothetical protein
MDLAGTPRLLERVELPASLLRVRSGAFALVEHFWHLADLEAEFGARIRRLLEEDDPFCLTSTAGASRASATTSRAMLPKDCARSRRRARRTWRASPASRTGRGRAGRREWGACRCWTCRG